MATESNIVGKKTVQKIRRSKILHPVKKKESISKIFIGAHVRTNLKNYCESCYAESVKCW